MVPAALRTKASSELQPIFGGCSKGQGSHIRAYIESHVHPQYGPIIRALILTVAHMMPD